MIFQGIYDAMNTDEMAWRRDNLYALRLYSRRERNFVVTGIIFITNQQIPIMIQVSWRKSHREAPQEWKIRISLPWKTSAKVL